MANHLDLEEQEQLDQLKHFWKQHGDWMSWVLIAVLGAVAAWYGYQNWQVRQAQAASVLFEELDKSVKQLDVAKADRIFSDLKDQFPSSIYAAQAGLGVARVAFEGNKVDVAKAALVWVTEHAKDPGLQSVAALRLSAVLIDANALDEAMKVLDGVHAPEFAPLVADRKGDILARQTKLDLAKAQYKVAFDGLEKTTDYRRVLEIKLNALGVDVSEPNKAEAVQ